MGALFSIHVDTKKVVAALKDFKKEIRRKLQTAMTNGMREFKGEVQTQQYTGRPGLNVQTGTLRRSWRVWRIGSIASGNFVVKMVTNVKYARIHDKSRTGTGYTGRNYASFIPVRTNVAGHFQHGGRAIVIGHISDALANLVRRGIVI